MQIRKATLADVEMVTQLRAGFIEELRPVPLAQRQKVEQAIRQYLQAHIPNNSCLVALAEEEGNLVATGLLAVTCQPPSDRCLSGLVGYISSIYTLLPHRGKGCATAVVKWLIDEAARQDVRAFTLTATAKGRPIYQKLGFVPGDDPAIYLNLPE